MEKPARPHIVQKICLQDSWQYHLHIPEDLVFFHGHFDELALLPGVTQVKWVVELAREELGFSSSTTISKLKFMRPIRPGQELMLLIKCVNKGKIDFKYFDDSGVFSEGQLCYE